MRRWTGGLRSAGVVGIGVVVLSGCPSPSDVSDDELTEGSDPWTSNVTYTDPDGRFAVDFPAEPQLSSKPDGPDLDIYSLTAEVDDGWEFTLAWSDAPRGTALVRTQEMRPQTAEENAARDGGKVIDERDIELFGRSGVQFTVGNDDGGFYHDLQFVLGGRLYELTTVQRVRSRQAFDRFVDSLQLLQPPRGDDSSDFFAVAEASCAGFFGSLPGPAEDATPAERGAAVAEVSDFYEGLVGQLGSTPAAPDEEGDAAAFIDAIRRSIAPGRKFAAAVANDAANVRELGQATHADTDLALQLAKDNGAPSCV